MSEVDEQTGFRLDAKGWAYLNPDSGNEWSESHPIMSGEVTDAENVKAMTLRKFRKLFPLEGE